MVVAKSDAKSFYPKGIRYNPSGFQILYIMYIFTKCSSFEVVDDVLIQLSRSKAVHERKITAAMNCFEACCNAECFDQ